MVKDKDFLEKSLTYIMFTNDYSQDEIIELLEKNKIGGEQMPNLGQRLIDKGRDQGIQQGMLKGKQEGRQEGMQEGKTELILNMLNQGIKVEDVSKFTGLPIEEIKLIIDKAN